MRRAFVGMAVAGMLVTATWITVAEGAGAPGRPTRVIRLTRYYDEGPSARYGSDFGAIGTVQPLRVLFPAGTQYDVVVTLSLNYRTSPDEDFVLGVGVRRGSRVGATLPPRPNRRPIATATVRTSTTAAFALTGLAGGRDFWFSPYVNTHFQAGGASISTSRVLMVVEATPTG